MSTSFWQKIEEIVPVVGRGADWQMNGIYECVICAVCLNGLLINGCQDFILVVTFAIQY